MRSSSEAAANLPRVCILVESFHPNIGGTERQVRLLAEDLSRDGAQVILITRRTDPRLPRTENLDGIEVRRIGPTGTGPLKKWGMLFACLVPLIRLRRRYDLVYVPGFRVLGMSAVSVSRVLRKPCVFRAVSLGEMSGRFFDAGLRRRRLGGLWQPLLRVLLPLRNRLLRRANAFVAISEEVLREYRDNGVPGSLIHGIPNPVDINRFRPVNDEEKRALRRRLSLPPDRRIVTYAGRLVSSKGLPALLRAWERLGSAAPEARLLLVGEGSNDVDNCENDLKLFCTEHRLHDRVRFTGRVENVHEYLQASDVFAFPTENEAFGISLIEAMACGVPVVSTAAGGVRDIVRDGENALVVRPGDSDALAGEIRRLLLDEPLARTLAANALRMVRDRYARQTVTAGYERLFRSLCARPGPRTAEPHES